MKAEDIDLRPIYHYLEDRVRSHVFLCMLATYLTWHLRRALAPLTFTDNAKPAREDPVVPARRSAAAAAKDTGKITPDKLPVRGYHELVAHLATLTEHRQLRRETPRKLTTPTPEQRPSSSCSASPSRSASTDRNHRTHATEPPSQLDASARQNPRPAPPSPQSKIT